MTDRQTTNNSLRITNITYTVARLYVKLSK